MGLVPVTVSVILCVNASLPPFCLWEGWFEGMESFVQFDGPNGDIGKKKEEKFFFFLNCVLY